MNFGHSAMRAGDRRTNRIELQGAAWMSTHNSSAIGAGHEGRAARTSEGNSPLGFALRCVAHQEQEHILHTVILAVCADGWGDVS